MRFQNSAAVRQASDFFNAAFIVGSVVYFNLMRGFDEPTNLIISLYVIFYMTVLVFNAYVCEIMLRIKDRVITGLVAACSEHEPLPEERQQLLEWKLERSLQVGDIAEVAFGRLGRLVTESALGLTVMSMVISQMASVRLVFIITMKIENSTAMLAEYNSTYATSFDDDSWPTELGTYTAIFLPIFLVLSLLPTYRSLAPISFVAVIAIIVPFSHMISLYYGLSTTIVNYSNKERFEQVDLYESSSPQLGYAILALSNSAADNRSGFRLSLLVATMLTFCGTCVANFALCFYNRKSPIWKYPLLMKFSHELCPNIITLSGYVAFVFFLNLPLFQLLERWASRMIASPPRDDALEALLPPTRSVFERLRQRGRSLDPPDIEPEDVFRDVRAQVPLWLFVSLRVIVVVAEWALSILCWNNSIAITIFLVIEVVSTIFIGYVLPVIQNLRFLWYEMNAVYKFVSLFVVIAMIGVTVYIYVSTYTNAKLYRLWKHKTVQ